MAPRPKVTVNQATVSEILAEIAAFAAIASREEAEEIGEAMVVEVEAIVSAEFQTPDSRKINTTRLENSFTYVLSGNDRDGWDVSLTIKPGVSSGKIWALNYGRSGASRNYTIRPRNVPRALEFKGPGTDYSYARESGKYAGRVLRPHANRTTAGDIPGSFFMERARENVLRARGYDDLV